MSEFALGRFGGRRLEKGGPSCMPGLWRRADGRFGFAAWAGIGLERSA
jgi:hypothetical protein